MKVTFPHLGTMHIFCKAIAETAGIDYIVPPKTSARKSSLAFNPYSNRGTLTRTNFLPTLIGPLSLRPLSILCGTERDERIYASAMGRRYLKLLRGIIYEHMGAP